MKYPISGNYWDDHDDHDEYHGPNQDTLGSDGIADQPGGGLNPYTKNGVNDKYPYVNFNDWNELQSEDTEFSIEPEDIRPVLPQNNPPDKPTNPTPPDGATDVDVNPALSVDVFDPDDDILVVIFYDASDDSMIDFETDVPSGGTASILWSGLEYETSYNWYAKVFDGEYFNQSDTWEFTTTSQSNNPPDPPYNPNPPNGEMNVPVYIVLSWDGGDPDPEDTVTYDVYFEPDDPTPDELVSYDQPDTTFDPGTLSYNTKYYWQIIARDNHEATTEGPIWNFTTTYESDLVEFILNYPPNGSTNINLNPLLNVKVTNLYDGSPLDVTFLEPMADISTKHMIAQDNFGFDSIYAIDIDDDEDIDMVSAQGVRWRKEIAWWENNGNQVFTKHIIDNNFEGAKCVYANDIDGDKDIDIVATSSDANEVAWWGNNGDQEFTKHSIDTSFYGAYDVYASDIDGDDDVDVVATALYGDEIAWWENNGEQEFTKHIIDTVYNPTYIYPVDIDNDEDVDILGSSTWGDEIAWWENNGNQEFTKHSIDNNFNGAKSVHATDIDGDNDIDVIAAAYYNEIAWWENNGDQEFTKHSIDTSFDGALDVYAIDIDYDKDIDIVATAKCANEVAWFENNGHEEFTKNIIDNSFDNAYDVIATDIDKDGDIDIAAASSDGDEIAWWENNQSIGQNLNVPSGSNATTIWYGLESSTTYYWRVIAKDADGNSALSPIWHFTTSTIIHDDHFQTVPPHSIQPIPP